MEAVKVTPEVTSIDIQVKPNQTTTIEKVDKTLTDELLIAISSPIGSLKEPVIDNILDIIKINYGYETEVIKLSNFFSDYKSSEQLVDDNSKSPAFREYSMKIQTGNLIRKENNNSYLAERAIQQIHLERLNNAKTGGISDPKPEDFVSRRKLYLIDSIKSKEELELFRKVYTENFYQISLFSPIEDRRNNLSSKGFTKGEIEEIIEIDDKQNLSYGQNVRDTFVDGDFFMRVSEDNIISIQIKIKRFFDLVFESQVITPTTEEQSMYFAKSASGNSACLSRQVGACITDSDNNVLSVGWNDVPKFGGNLYTADSPLDNRCYNKGYCSNDREKSKIINGIIESFLSDEELEKLLKVNGAINTSIVDRIKESLQRSKVKDLIEFSRSVHAEMHAIIQSCQQTGNKIIGGRLFCTTYPCHNCARHIVAAGLIEVYYIEPYVKSLCLTLHNDTMTESEKVEGKVKILMFDGVAPRSYLTFFTNFAQRKLGGKIIKKDLTKLKPKRAKSLQALSTLEQQAVHSLNPSV